MVTEQEKTGKIKTGTWNATVTPQEHSLVKIVGELPYAELQTHRTGALATLGKNISIDGFRKGHIPEKVLLERIGEMALLSEMAERALARFYPEIIRAHALNVIGHPYITLTTLEPNNPLGFSAVVAVMPHITLPDYKKLARTIKKEPATDADDPQSSEDNSAEKVIAKYQVALTDMIVEQSVIDLPHILIEAELGQMFGQMEQDLARANLRIDDYLIHIQKTKEVLISEWTPIADKRAKLQLILNEIAKRENITASRERIEEEVARLVAQYKDADQDRVRLYITSLLVNEEVLKMLEKQNV